MSAIGVTSFEVDREKINKRLFGVSLEGNNRIPLTQKTTQKLCGIGIKRDSLNYQFRGCGAVPQSRSKREAVILDSSGDG